MEDYFFDFNPWGGWLTVGLLLAVSLYSIYRLFLKATVPMHAQYKTKLILIRIAAVLLMVFVATQMSIVYKTTVQEKIPLLIAVDSSLSMGMNTAEKNTTRWDCVLKLLEAYPTRFKELEKNFLVEWACFDDSIRPFSKSTRPSGYKTAFGNVIKQWRSQLSPGAPGNILLISDGANNFGSDPVALASTLKLEKRKIFSIGIGDRENSISTLDASVEDIVVPDGITTTDKINIEAQVSFKGMAGAITKVEFLVDGEIVETREIIPRGFFENKTINITLSPYNYGSHLIEIRIPEVPGESTSNNNRLVTYFKVLQGDQNLLYAEGSLRYEYTFLKRLIQKNKSLNPTISLLRTMDKESFITESIWRRYNLIILGDMNASTLGLTNLEAIKSHVESGANLITLCGLNTYASGDYYGTPLADILPFDLDDNSKQLKKSITMVPSFEGVNIPFMQIFEKELRPKELMDRYREMPQFPGFYKIDTVKADAEVIARTTEGDPLIIRRQYGKGTVVSLAVDTTWKWILNPLEDEKSTGAAYGKFWNRLISSMISPNRKGDFNVTVTTSTGTTAPEDSVDVFVKVTDVDGKEVSEAEMIVLAKTPVGNSVSIPMAFSGNVWRGKFTPKLEGHFTISAVVAKDGAKLGEDETKLYSFLRDRETSNPATNFSLLDNLAQRTGAQSSIWTNATPVFIELLRTAEGYKTETVRKDNFWANPLIFLVFLALLAADWIIRKKNGLP